MGNPAPRPTFFPKPQPVEKRLVLPARPASAHRPIQSGSGASLAPPPTGPHGSVSPSLSIPALPPQLGLTQAPFAENSSSAGEYFSEIERLLRERESRVLEREQTLLAAQTKLLEREREVWEMEALVKAREKMVDSLHHQAAGRAGVSGQGLSADAQAALQQMKTEIEKQEQAVKEAREALKERERFLEQSENMVFEKAQTLQEKETELEQREENLRDRERLFQQREGKSADAPALAAETISPSEFRE